MIKYFFFLILWMPLGLMGQSPTVQLLDESINEGWTSLDEGWQYQKGDDLNWAQPSYDDKEWPVVPKNSNLNRVEDIEPIVKNVKELKKKTFEDIVYNKFKKI